MAKDLVHVKLFNNESFVNNNIEDGIKTAFIDADNEIVSTSIEQDWMNGCTAVISVILDNKLYTANIGDSEAVIIAEEDGEINAECLITHHKASTPDEKQRITDMGGLVFFGRVFGSLAVSRSFGDSRFKEPKTSANFVSADPAITVVHLQSSHKALVLACDGLWDVCDYNEVAQHVINLRKEGKTPEQAATFLVQLALDKQTDDNVTAIVVYLDWEEESQ
eukprot:TRINITY_DN394_c0_g1_i2.p1 TRINITY_DN394_c0_g1~~TRINITY_DN394_c0_g1_i2.p1  ORF type:complete len:221 (+),score=39.28 TRINITY_DN394_c0_g1_i2:338-1000(+)